MRATTPSRTGLIVRGVGWALYVVVAAIGHGTANTVTVQPFRHVKQRPGRYRHNGWGNEVANRNGWRSSRRVDGDHAVHRGHLGVVVAQERISPRRGEAGEDHVLTFVQIARCVG